jgi:hypothetical protein
MTVQPWRGLNIPSFQVELAIQGRSEKSVVPSLFAGLPETVRPVAPVRSSQLIREGTREVIDRSFLSYLVVLAARGVISFHRAFCAAD